MATERQPVCPRFSGAWNDCKGALFAAVIFLLNDREIE
jgi:hypothetical protein